MEPVETEYFHFEIYIYIYNTIWDSWLLNSVKICNWKSSNSLGELEGNFWWMPINQHSHQRTKWAFNMRKVKKESGKFYLGVNPSLQVYNTIISPMWYGLCHSISMWIKFMRWKSLIKINKKKNLKDADFWLNVHYFISVTQDNVVWLSNRHVSLIS